MRKFCSTLVVLTLLCIGFLPSIDAGSMIDLESKPVEKVHLISWIRNYSRHKVDGLQLKLGENEWLYGDTPWVEDEVGSNLIAEDEILGEFNPSDTLPLGIFELFGPKGVECFLDAELILNIDGRIVYMAKTVSVPCDLDGVAIIFVGEDFEVLTSEKYIQLYVHE